jgi:hypothetical protein
MDMVTMVSFSCLAPPPSDGGGEPSRGLCYQGKDFLPVFNRPGEKTALLAGGRGAEVPGALRTDSCGVQDAGGRGGGASPVIPCPLANAKLIETSTKGFFIILSAAKDLVCIHNDEMLRSLRSLRMTVERTFAEVSN